MHLRRTLRTAAVLAVPVLSALPLVASQPASAKGVIKANVASVAYCIPPSTASVAATQNASNTSAVLSTFTEGGLAKAGAFSVPVGASSAGAIGIALTSGRTLVGVGGTLVGKSGCFQLKITLTNEGKQLLNKDETSKTPISILISSAFVPQKGKAGIAQTTATVKP
jgi:hypothetical protein